MATVSKNPADLANLAATHRAVAAAIRQRQILSCHDVSEGGLAVAAAEMCIASGLGLIAGAETFLTDSAFAEAPGRYLVELPDSTPTQSLAHHFQDIAGISDIGALILEVVMTAGFVTVILTATKRSPGLAPLVIPLTLIAIHFGSATVSGASVNPARSIGSALVGGNLGALWIYLVAPILGAIVGWAVFMALDEDEPAPVS